MLFPTLQFVLFFALVLILSIPLRSFPRVYKLFLILVSVAFYIGFGATFTFYFLAFCVVNTVFVFFYQKNPRKRYLIVGIFLNLIFLGIFKYYNFFTDSIFSFLYSINIQLDYSVIQIAAPIGISFYTFRAISGIFDIYRKKMEKISPLDYMTYLTFFPQVTSGPIARPKEFLEGLYNSSSKVINTHQVILLLMSGILKKLVLSSYLFSVTQQTFSTPEVYSSFDLIVGSLAYAAMIYTDFSGYTDLANAITIMLGLNPVENFNGPYSAASLQEFWKKWHISLSTWLRDYLYIPLGGNRKGVIRTYINIFLTMLIGGFWHGAGLTFIAWGALHGLGLIINHGFSSILQKKSFISSDNKIFKFATKFISILITFAFINITWIFFNSRNMDIALAYIKGIFGSNGIEQIVFWDLRLFFVIILVILMNFFGSKFYNFFAKVFQIKNKIIRLAILIILFYIILQLGPTEVPPFIYFNF